MRPTDIRARIAPDGTAEVHVNGARVTVKQLAIVATAGEGCEVTLTLVDCTVNGETAGPDAADLQDDAMPAGAVFSSLCHGCGKLFRNGDGHRCDG